MTNEKQFDRTLDLRGWSCPWCILKAKSWLKHMSSGQVLEVISTDPQIQKNFPHVLEKSPDRVIKMDQKNGCYHVLVKRG
ncbi:MAG: sulfurtransferase TusA family protein [Deltaproteobacteria bacterium]|nr:sulfurtransferase TusA family protein [Deltaproteobacteria bacterium]MBW2050204.1 sulfurtransferase TusA family protein [Deltaproteobacteria bacterium]MBW2352331.1 sulfurtransferase TusA family protein [Deltaproteobacteria bacterium]